MKRRENGQAVIDFLLLLVVLIGIPLGLLFRYDVQLRHASVRAVRGMGMTLRSWRGETRKKAAPPSQAAPAEKAKPAPPASAPAEQAKPAAPAAPAAPAK